METISGIVEEIIFYNEENGYCVAAINSKGEYITIVGTMYYLSPGESITLQGEFKEHPVYGEQFSVTSFEKSAPNSIDSIYKYLSSGMLKGIREGLAKKIIDAFGENSLDVIENDPEKLSEIKGISIKKAYEISNEYILQFGLRTLVIFLQQYDIPATFAPKIYKALGNDAISKIKINPFVLTKKIKGIGFKTVDNIAYKMGIEPNHPERIQAAVKYVLTDYTGYGNTYVARNNLIYATSRLLNCDETIVNNAIDTLIYERELVSEIVNNEEAIYLISMHIAETNCAYRLKMLNSRYPKPVTDELKKLVSRVEEHTRISLETNQKQAVLSALTMPVMVITGGPGTGKTTVINTIIHCMEHQGKSVVLAAPTGRAAKRMSEMTKKDAKTLHRLLELGYSADDEDRKFAKDENNPIEADVIIVDEMSMVDLLLFNSLLKAIAKDTTLILVGDADQLPSIGPGNVLRDIINSDGIAVVKLTEIFRQARESLIVVNAHKINKGEFPVLNEKNKDFFFMQRNTPEEINNRIVELCLQRLPNAYGFNPFSDIQVLSPTRKGPVGLRTLNNLLQNVLNPSSERKKEKASGDYTFREFDKIMQIKNNYDMPWTNTEEDDEGFGLFNGDIGIIKDISAEFDSMDIVFDEVKNTSYPFANISDLELAYATTIHKSQGSEFPAVVIPLYPSSISLLSRNLLYTAITRAKKLVILVGQQSVLSSMINNNKEVHRCSGLKDRLTYN